MNEMAHALATLGAIRSAHLLITPTGKFALCGMVPARACYMAKDGNEATDKQLADAAKFGVGLVGLRSKVYDTAAAAWQAVEQYGGTRCTAETCTCRTDETRS